MRGLMLLSGVFLAACTTQPETASPASADPRLAEGRMLVDVHCSACHAIGPRDRSKHAEAPAFRTLSRNYPVDALAEPLAEGIMVGHPEMPEFRFRAEDVDSIVAYLESIQEK